MSATEPGPGGPGGRLAVRLAQVAGELLEEGGPQAVTMRAVGARAGVSAMAIYRHYANREALLGHLVDAAFADLAGQFDGPGAGDVVAALHAMLDHVLDLAFRRPHLYALVFTDRRPGARVLPAQAADSPTLRRLIAALQQGMADGVLRPDDPAEVALATAALVQGLWLARHAGRIDLPEPEFRALCHRCAGRMIDGLRA